jgi:hypothetical protein
MASRYAAGFHPTGKAHTEDEIRGIVESKGWELRGLTGTRTKDTATIYCAKHDHEQQQKVLMVLQHQRGCRECGYDRVRKSGAKA